MRRDLTRDILSPSLLFRFHDKYIRRGDNECWEWCASRTPLGYGRIGVTDPLSGEHRNEYGHRLAFLINAQTDIPAGMVVMHTCDNPSCCNPKHLRLGTSSDNAFDRERKGRRLYGVELTDLDIAVIIRWYQNGMSTYAIGKEFVLDPSRIRSVLVRSGISIRPNPRGKK